MVTPATRTNQASQVQRSGPLSFLDLPSEVRNQIYGYCIIRTEVEIISKVKTAIKTYGQPKGRAAGHPEGPAEALPWRFCREWEEQTIDTDGIPVRGRSSWIVVPMEYYRKYIVNPSPSEQFGPMQVQRYLNTPGGFHPYEATYAMDYGSVPQVPGKDPALPTALFLLNRQITWEAATMFFEHNHFIFTVPWESTHFAPMAFFWDHPGALSWVRSLQINIHMPPSYLGYPYHPTIEFVVPSNGMWRNLIAQIRKMKLRHFGVSIPGNITNRYKDSNGVNRYLSRMMTAPWLEELYSIKGLESMRLNFDVEPRFANCDMSAHAPSDVPGLLSLCGALQHNWLSGRSSIQDTFVCTYSCPAYGDNKLEFRAWVTGHPQQQMPGKFWEEPGLPWNLDRDITELYQDGHYTEEGIRRALHGDAEAMDETE